VGDKMRKESKDLRSEFNKFRRKLLKENNIEHLICARCGEWRVSVHLHHLKELVYGGKNETKNLVPLCHRCHYEWDYWGNGDFNFGTFLLTPPIWGIRDAFFGKMAISKHSLMLYRATQRTMRSVEYAAMYHDGENDDQYEEEWGRQNRIFNTYPYSNMTEMFNRYGEVSTPLVLEDLAMVNSDGVLLNHVKSKYEAQQKGKR